MMKFDVRKMAPRRSRPAPLPRSIPGTPTCCFCGLSEDDEVVFGKLCIHDGIVTHYYCLLLSSNMEQNGDDNEGILGFMTADIQKELRRGKRLSCSYCRRPGATLGCCNTRCKRVFHLPCGIREGSLHQFFGEFRSYCITHRIKQEIDKHIKAEAAAAGTVTCYICYEEVCPKNAMQTLWAPCCRKNAWFHRRCVQRLALSAGYFFKCPLCNNNNDFQKAMLEHGIFIPNQDASWELVPNAYQELLHRHNCCDAKECLCPKGRSHTGVNAKWELLLCRLCGSQGVHRACGHIKWASSVWECEECVSMLRKTNEASPRSTNQLKEATVEEVDESSSSDSEISVGGNVSPLTVTVQPDSLPSTTPSVKLRPGPRSFKLQQAVQNAKSIKITRTDASISSLQEKHDMFLPENIPSTSRSHGDEADTVLEKEGGDQLSLEKTIPLEIDPLPSEINTTVAKEAVVTLDETNVESAEEIQHTADLIVIDSDDDDENKGRGKDEDGDEEVEIISITPKQSILTTKDGTQIPIHSLSQASEEPHNAEGDVKIIESTASRITELPTSQTKENQPKRAVLRIRNPSLVSTITPKIPPSNVIESPVISKTTAIPGARKSPGNNLTPNSVHKDKNVLEENSLMSLKITNVTSLRQDFSNPFREPILFQGIGFQSSICVNSSDNLISKSPAIGKSQPHNALAPHGLAAMKNVNAKRKSEGYAEKTACNSSNQGVTENGKKARFYEAVDSGIPRKDRTVAWSINMNNDNGESIPLLVRSVPINRSGNNNNNNRFKQSSAVLKPKELETSSDKSAMPINSIEVQHQNGFHVNPLKQSLASSYERKLDSNIIHASSLDIEPSLVRPPKNFMEILRVTKTYSAKHHLDKDPKANYVDSQATVNGNRQNLGKATYNCSEQMKYTSTHGNSANSATGIRAPPTVFPTPGNTSKDIQRFDENKKKLQTNVTTSNVLLYNSSRGHCKGGNQQNTNNSAKASQSMSQPAEKGIPIPQSCDGDAGSGSTAEARSNHQAFDWRSSVRNAAEPIGIDGTDDESGSKQNSILRSGVSAHVTTNPTTLPLEFSARKYCDKPRMIPEKVPLRNINFRVLDQEIIQIVFRNTSKQKIRTDTRDMDRPTKHTRKQFTPPSQNGESKVSSATANLNDTPNGKLKSSSVEEKKCSTRVDLSLNETVANLNSDIDYKEKTNSVTEISSMVGPEIENSLCKENLFKEGNERFGGPVCTNNCVCLNNLCEKDQNINYVDKCECFSGKLRVTSSQVLKGNKNSDQNFWPVDFFRAGINYSDYEREMKLPNGFNKIPKSLIRSLGDRSKLNSSVDCYASVKNTVNRSSRIRFVSKESNTKVQDSTEEKPTTKLDDDSSIDNENKKISMDAIFDKKITNIELNGIPTSSSSSLSCQNIDNHVSSANKLEYEICSRIDKNLSSDKSDLSIKVRIDLDKIQNFVDDNPHLFFKDRCETESKCINNNRVVEKFDDYPNSVSIESSHFSRTKLSKEARRNMEKNPKTRKKF